MFLKSRWHVTKVVYSLIGIYDIPEPGGTGWWPRPGGTSAASIPVTGSGLDSHEPNAAIGLITSATASIMAGSCLVRWEVCGAIPDCLD